VITAGCDIGSLTGKVVILNNGEIVSKSIVPATPKVTQTAIDAMDKALKAINLRLDEINYVLGTGYGRAKIPFAKKSITEISCHAKGAHWVMPTIRTVLDIGGQDSKAISVDGHGNVANFVMNDKCAAGSGRFLEVMAAALGLQLEDLGPMGLQAKSPAKISSQCTVFAETEVVSLISEGMKLPDIVAGINQSVADRLASQVKRIGVKKDITITGGVAKNIGVTTCLEAELGEVKKLPIDPQLVGALGAAVIAIGLLERSA
jgi:predicted CoA-substrate-specific enzyme activase